MSDTGTVQAPKQRTPVGTIILTVVILLFWALHLAMLTGLSGSDAAGNGMAQGFTAIELILLWLLMFVLILITAAKAALRWTTIVPMLALLPVSGYAAMRALDLLSHPNSPPYFWPMEVAAVVVPCFVAFCLWARIPSLRAAIPARLAIPVTFAGILLGSASVVPFILIREGELFQEAVERARWDEAYRRLPRDAPLWEWTALLPGAQGIQEDAMLDGIRHLDRRQNDAETMLRRGDFPLGYLGRMDLNPTREICDLARAMLRDQAARLVLKPGEEKAYSEIQYDVSDAVAAMEWLVGYDCSCDAESQAWEATANQYTGTDFDVVRLREMRDPNELGRILRERPEHFSQLTPRSHLMAWLHYASDASLREKALAGARALEHRNDDALDMLNGSEYVAWDLLIYLPDLDLEATPALCEAALREVHRELARIYRPRNDDPRPYQELLERMGTGRPLEALVWLGRHGCDAETQVTEAEGLVSSYQDSTDRLAMLAVLGGLHRKP